MKKIHVLTFSAICMMVLSGCSGGAVQTAVGGGQMPDKIRVENSDTQVIEVNTSESISVVPDMAQVVYAVTTQDKDAAACQSANSEKTGKLVEALKAMGIEEKSIRTSRYDLNPQRDWNKNDGDNIVGYEMTAEVTVSDVPMEQVGKLLSGSVEAGVNQIQSVTYQSSQYDASYQEALAKAVAKAQEKAQALADASGVTLGHAVRITEHVDDQMARYRNTVNLGAGKMVAETTDEAALMPGEIAVEADISVQFAIQ